VLRLLILLLWISGTVSGARFFSGVRRIPV